MYTVVHTCAISTHTGNNYNVSAMELAITAGYLEKQNEMARNMYMSIIILCNAKMHCMHTKLNTPRIIIIIYG